MSGHSFQIARITSRRQSPAAAIIVNIGIIVIIT